MDVTTFIGPVSSAVFYGLSLLSGVFFSGWFLNSKMKSVFDENNKGLEAEVSAIKARVIKLEEESVKTQQHDKDMTTMFGLVNELKDDIRNGFTNVTKRIDDMFKRD